MEKKNILKDQCIGIFCDVWQKVKPLLIHVCVVALLAPMMRGLSWLLEVMLPPELGKYVHPLERILYVGVFVLLALSVLKQFFNLLSHKKSDVEELQKKLQETEKAQSHLPDATAEATELIRREVRPLRVVKEGIPSELSIQESQGD